MHGQTIRMSENEYHFAFLYIGILYGFRVELHVTIVPAKALYSYIYTGMPPDSSSRPPKHKWKKNFITKLYT